MRHSLKADRFFSEEERNRIIETTKVVESRTIGEVAVMVVDSSAQYSEAEVTGGFLLGSLCSFVLTISYFHASLWIYIPMSFVFFFPSLFVFKIFPFLKTAFIGPKGMETAVRLRAERAFFEKGLYRTKQNTAVLFFLSLLERRVWVLADKGIYEKIDQEILNRLALTVSQGIKDGRGCDALCLAVKEAGALLAKHFPVTHDDINELPDKIISE